MSSKLYSCMKARMVPSRREHESLRSVQDVNKKMLTFLVRNGRDSLDIIGVFSY